MIRWSTISCLRKNPRPLNENQQVYRMALLFFSPRKPSAAEPGDWSQQELAEIYRVLHLLQKAGVCVDLDRGLTDKDEPWAVFFDPNGEDVFLHIARLNGKYLLVSEVLDIKVVESSFRKAIDQFESAVGVAMKNNTDRSSNVVVHPAAQLMFSLVAVFLIVKSKSAQASTEPEDTGTSADFAKIRAFLGRLQEAIENPVMMAAMVSALVLSSSTGQDPLDLEKTEVAGKTRKTLPADEAAAEAEIAAAQDEIDVQRQAEVTEQAHAAEAEQLDQLPVAAEAAVELEAQIEVAELNEDLLVHVTGAEDVGVVEDEFAAASEQDAVVVEGEAAEKAEVADRSATENIGNSSTSPSENVLEPTLIESAESLLATILNETTFSQQDLITVARGGSAADVMAIVSEAGTTPEVITLTDSSSTADFQMANDADAAPAGISPAVTVDPVDYIYDLIALFGDVDLYSTGNNSLIVVDTEVQHLSGSEIAFVSEEIFDGFTVSLVGSKEMIEANLPV